MEDKLKEEYLSILNKIDKLTEVFEKLEKQTLQLKVRYQENPDEEGLMDLIKNHEENYRLVYEKMLVLNKQAKQLKDKYTK